MSTFETLVFAAVVIVGAVVVDRIKRALKPKDNQNEQGESQ